MKKMLIVVFSIIVLFIMLCVYSYIKIDVTQYEVYGSNLPEGFNDYKILLLSDLHNRDLNEKIKKICDEEKPNIIVMAGDMANHDAYSIFIKLAESLSDYDMYYVTGNHEQDMSSKVYEKFINDLEKNVNVLDNEVVKIYLNDEYINLYGLNYPLRHYSKKGLYSLTNSNISARIGKTNNNEYNILLTHNPLFYKAYNEWGSDLTLSGHIHGGIVRIPFVGGVLSPDFTFFPKYSSGLNKIEDMNLVVSRGLGYGDQLKVRVNNPGEVVIVKLKVK